MNIQKLPSRSESLLPENRVTCDELTSMTLPQPPNRSFPQPYTTRPIPTCLKADAHITQGSTVTYSVIDDKGAGWSGSKWSIASSSACNVAYKHYQLYCPGNMPMPLTLRHSFVLFLALAIACPSLTKTHPTGTSSALRASSACLPQLDFSYLPEI